MNELKHLAEFQKALNHYQPSVAAQKMLTDLTLVLLVAPTSAGRNTVIRELLKSGQYQYLISDTTRKPRINDGVLEQDGKEYYFRTEEAVLQDIQKGEFLEVALIHEQQISGISMRELQKAHDDRKIAITDIEIKGVATILSLKPDSIVIFMVPPTFEAWMQRLYGRGAMDTHELRRRLESACKEFRTALEQPMYQFVVNDELPHTVQTIKSITTTKLQSKLEQERARILIQELYEQTTDFLMHIVP